MISNVNLSSIKIVDLRVPSQIILTNENNKYSTVVDFGLTI